MKTINVYDGETNLRQFSQEYKLFRTQAMKLSKKFLTIQRIEELNEQFDFKIEYTLNARHSQVESITFTDDRKYLEFLLRTSDE